ncbi:ABC1 kinase family protein [Spirochaeta thermophila]|uniref:ABC1 kinase family protein n=1 Tax=Winmispira thermophila TaxID=154 RepID=UPI0001F148EC|nr:AarF/UbiB family protein [Spirochaeta thermophila]
MRRARGRKARLARYREIFALLVGYGFDEALRRLPLRGFFVRKRRGGKVEGLPYETRVRLLLEDLGPTFIKFGQLLSNRPDLVPPRLAHELMKLQDRVAPYPSEEAFAIFEEELGVAPSEVFTRIEREPIASASMAQVYRAHLPSGEQVAVKIQRPHLEEIIETDLEIMERLGSLLEQLFFEGHIPMKALVREFGRQLRKEMDFSGELRRIQRFREIHAGMPQVMVPHVYERLSGSRVLTMQYVEGIRVSELDALRDAGIDPAGIARVGVESVLTQIFVHGFFHADPHPGNILVLPNGSLCFLDFGAMGVLDPSTRIHLAQIFLGIGEQSPQKVVYGLLSLSVRREGLDRRRLEQEVYDLIQDYALLPLGALNVKEVIERFYHLILHHRLVFPPGLYLFFKTLLALEALGRTLDPGFQLVEYLQPHVKRFVVSTLRKNQLLKNIPFFLSEAFDSLNETGFEIPQLIQRLKEGKVVVDLSDTDLKLLSQKVDESTTRLSLSLIIAAAIVGSSILIQAKIPPLWNGVSILGIVGLATVGILGGLLVLHFLRKS